MEKPESLSHQFIEFIFDIGVLRLGEFELKSGRKSPYFFNAGGFQTGSQLGKLGYFYSRRIAQLMTQENLDFDLVFGPAYKGIPLASSVCINLSQGFEKDVGYTFNRKEAKQHGEGGQLVGASLTDHRVLIVDDVITAGTAINESMALIDQHQATAVAAIVAFNRQESGYHGKSAIAEIRENHQIPVYSISNFHDLVTYITQHPEKAPAPDMLEQLHRYQQTYGTST